MDSLAEYLLDGCGMIDENMYNESCEISIPLVLERVAEHPVLYFREIKILKLDLKNFNIKTLDEGLREDIFYKQIFIFYTRNEVILSMPTWSVFNDFIKECNRDFVLIPILIDIDDDPIRHVGLLIIDCKNKKVYNFDPNGNPNNILRNIDFMNDFLSSNCADHLFLEYFEDTGYQYKPTDKITLDRGINSGFYLKFDKGNCGSWVILFGIMVLNSGEKKLAKIYEKLLELKWDERGYLIYNFIGNYLTKCIDYE